ncbi:unnamed protein product, partial [Urochloa humidicola]
PQSGFPAVRRRPAPPAALSVHLIRKLPSMESPGTSSSRPSRSMPHEAPAAASNAGVLPADVLFDVLLRLPAKELCRLRAVCRAWRSLTFDPLFAVAHAAWH